MNNKVKVKFVWQISNFKMFETVKNWAYSIEKWMIPSNKMKSITK